MSCQSSSIFNSSSPMSESDAFNLYVCETMHPCNKVNSWFVNFKDMKIPIVVVMKDSEFISMNRRKARKEARRQFKCTQCAYNCDKLVSIIGKSNYTLCSYKHNTTAYTDELSSIARCVYHHAKANIDSYSLQIATNTLLLEDKHSYVNPNNPLLDASKTFLHYAGNCDTISSNLLDIKPEDNPLTKKHNANARNLKLLNLALHQYFHPMQKLLYKISDTWNLAGCRHATLQRIRTINEISREVTYAEAHFDKTLKWILNIISRFTKPFNSEYYNIENIVEIVSNAIAEGEMSYSDTNEKSVVHFQYAQMNNTIMMWMTKAVSRGALKKMMVDLCGPNKGKRTKSVSVQQIESAEKLIGTNFWTRVATTTTLQNFYGDSNNSKFFWTSPHIRQSNMSGGSSGFAKIKENAKNNKKPKSHICQWDTPVVPANSIPELIKLLVAGKSIYIDCASNEHAVLAHTSIDPKYMACCPIEGKGALMWSFLGGRGFGVHRSGNIVWRKLVAIHHLKTGPFSNYILVCESSPELAKYINKNPVMGDWTLRANCKRSMGPVFSKLKETTHLSSNTAIGYGAGMEEYPIIGVGVCRGASDKLAYNHIVSYKIGTAFTNEIHKIIYYETPIVSSKYSPSTKAGNFCSNCGAPCPSTPANFCGNCGHSF